MLKCWHHLFVAITLVVCFLMANNCAPAASVKDIKGYKSTPPKAKSEKKVVSTISIKDKKYPNYNNNTDKGVIGNNTNEEKKEGIKYVGTNTFRVNSSNNILKMPYEIRRNFIDIRDLLYDISHLYGVSLMIAKEVKGGVKKSEIDGCCVSEILESALKKFGFSFKFRENCLFVAKKANLDLLMEKIYVPFNSKIIPNRKLNIDFKNVDLLMICRILSEIAGVEIRIADEISGNMILRIIDMPYETVLKAIVYLNGYRMLETEYSIIIVP